MFKFLFVFALAFALVGLSSVEAASRPVRETETETTEENKLENVQRQVETAFDSLKKSMEEIGARFSADDIVQGFHNLTAKLEGYAKMAAEQVASYTNQDNKPEEGAPVKEEAPVPTP